MKKQKSWEKRLSGLPDKLMVDFVESLSIDKRLYKYDIAGSIAHAKMLAKQKLIAKSDLAKIKRGLLKIDKEIAAGKFKFDTAYEDIHMVIEAALVKKIGEPAKKLHTGRSRNDQVTTDLRLWMRDRIDILKSQITKLQKALVAMAAKYADDVMPAYTHLQRAQPIVIAAYLLSFVEQLERDFVRFDNCQRLANISPLGCGAIAGSTLPLDRKGTAKQLGFSGLSYNSIDAVGDRDFCAEFVFVCSMIMTHLSRLSEDWIIFISNEFGFLRIDDAFCTSSSMMPQKRNADALELIRGGTLDGNKESFEDVNRWPHLIAAYLESGKKIEVQDTHFTNTRNNAFYVMNFGGTFLIDNCEFTHMSEGRPGRPSDALTVVTGEPNKPGFMRVSNCKFIADVPAYEDGMSPGGMFLAADNSSTLEVEGCYFYGIGQFFDQYDIASIHVYPRWNGVRIANNYFEQCAFASIVVKSVHNFVCTGNVISNGQTSVNFLRSEGAIAYDPGYQPFHEDEFVTHPRAVIANNIIDNPGCETDVGKVACISVHGTLQSHADDVIIANNVLKNGGYGIYIVYPDDITIANNIIEGAADGNAGIEHGILFVNAFGEIIISGNRIITPNGMGLYCVAEADSSKWYVIGNTFNHSSPDAYACTLRGVAYAKFSGNTFNATEGYSLIIKGGCGGACPVGWLSWDNSNIILAGPTTFNWPQISKASGFLSGTLSPYNLVVPAEIGTLYRQTSGTNNVLWQSMGTTKTSWVQMATSNIIPPVDSSTAVQIRKANGTASIVNVDTINSRVGIGTTSPARALHINDAMRVQPRSTAPSNPAEGDVYMDSTTHKLMVYDGNAWQACW